VTDTAKQAGPTFTAEDDAAYLRAQIALGIVKAAPPKTNGAGIKLPARERPLAGESLQDMTRRKESERAAENKQRWLEHCDHMKRQHIGIAREWAKRYDAIADGGSGG